MIDEIIKYGNFKSDKKNKNKTQIILTNTSRNINDFLQSLKYRYNGKYDKIPNYIVQEMVKFFSYWIMMNILITTQHHL